MMQGCSHGLSLVCGIARVAGERDDVADVADARRKHDQPLKAQSKSTVRHRAILPQVQVPCISLPLSLGRSESRQCLSKHSSAPKRFSFGATIRIMVLASRPIRTWLRSKGISRTKIVIHGKSWISEITGNTESMQYDQWELQQVDHMHRSSTNSTVLLPAVGSSERHSCTMFVTVLRGRGNACLRTPPGPPLRCQAAP
jgi:hypothetical protein